MRLRGRVGAGAARTAHREVLHVEGLQYLALQRRDDLAETARRAHRRRAGEVDRGPRRQNQRGVLVRGPAAHDVEERGLDCLILGVARHRPARPRHRVLVDDDGRHGHRVPLGERDAQVRGRAVVRRQRLHVAQDADALDALGRRRVDEMYEALVWDARGARHREPAGLATPLLDGHEARTLVHPLTHARLVARLQVHVGNALVRVGHHLREREAVQRTAEELAHARLPRRQREHAALPLDDGRRIASEPEHAAHDLGCLLRARRVGRRCDAPRGLRREPEQRLRADCTRGGAHRETVRRDTVGDEHEAPIGLAVLRRQRVRADALTGYGLGRGVRGDAGSLRHVRRVAHAISRCTGSARVSRLPREALGNHVGPVARLACAVLEDARPR